MKYSFVVLAMLFVSSMAAIITPPSPPSGPCPSGAGYSIDTNVPSSTSANFINNALHYNKDNLQSGTPVGPYFSLDSSKSASFFPNGSFDASFNLYGDASLSEKIGTMTLHSDKLSVDSSSYKYVGGDMTISTHFTKFLYPANSAQYQNFRDQTTTLHFEQKNVHTSPANNQPFANRLLTENGNLYLILWGSSGWNSALGKFEQAGQGTGFDLRVRLYCPGNPPPPPPIIEGCDCGEGGVAISYENYQQGQTLTYTGQSCVGLSFA